MYCKQQIKSYNRSVYCEQNDEVTILNTNGLVAIVESASGNRFPLLIELLSEDKVLVIIDEPLKAVKEQMELW